MTPRRIGSLSTLMLSLFWCSNAQAEVSSTPQLALHLKHDINQYAEPDIDVETTPQDEASDVPPPEVIGRSAHSPRTGFSISAGTALMFCLPDGRADCTNTFPGMALNTSMDVRFWYLGLSLDFDYGWFITDGDGVTSYALHATPVLKGFYPLDHLEIFLGFGSGYSSIGVTESRTESEASWSTLFKGMKVTGGVWLDLEDYGMPVGFSLDLYGTYYPHYSGERCTVYANAGPCLPEEDLDPEQRDVVDQLQLGTALRYTF